MKRISALLLAALALGSAGPAWGQWPCPQCRPGGNCPVPGFAANVPFGTAPTPVLVLPAPVPDRPRVEWRTRDDDAGEVRYLFVDGRQVGAYRWATDDWQDFDPVAGKWAAAPRKLFGWALRASVELQPADEALPPPAPLPEPGR